MKDQIATIILAAGSSSRLGQSKQLLLIDGKSLLKRTVEISLQVNDARVMVVLGFDSSVHCKEIEGEAVIPIINKHWSKGMGNSIKAGLTFALQSIPNLRAVLFLVCDQPKLSEEHLHNMISTYNQTQSLIIASSYANTSGIPVLFDHSYFPYLLEIPDQSGARQVIAANLDQVKFVHFPGGEIDIDIPEDLTNL